MFNWIIGIPLVTLFATVGLVIVIIPTTRHEIGRVPLNILLILIAVWTFCSVMFHSISFPSTLFWLYLIIACAGCTGIVGVHFSIQFAQIHGAIAKWLVVIPYILSSLAFVLLFLGKVVTRATLLPNGAVETDFGPMAPFMWGTIAVTTGIAIAILVFALVHSLRFETRRSILPLLGFIVMCSGALSNIVISHYPIDIAANFIFVALLSYTVVSRRAFRLSQKQPPLYSLSVIGVTLALCHAAMLTFCLKWLETTTGISILIATISVITFGLILFGPSRVLLVSSLVRYLFPETYRYRMAFSDLARVDYSVSKWRDSLIAILKIMADTTHADGAVILLRNRKTEYFETNAVVGHNMTEMLRFRLPVKSGLIKTLAEKGFVISSHEIGTKLASKDLRYVENDTLQAKGPTLYCEIQGYDELLAIVALTRKPPQVWDEMDDHDFVRLICNQVTPIIKNAELYLESQLEINERKDTEKELRESREQLVNFSRYLQSMREEERLNIAREIHDELGQSLTAIKMDLSWLKRRFPKEPESLLEKIESMSRLTDTTIQTVTRISTELRPGLLDDLGLLAAIEWQAEEFQNRTEIKCHLSLELEDALLDKDCTTTVFRILQESLTNVARHADATNVRVSLRQKAGDLVLKVVDNGVGIEEGKITHPRSFGLIGMRERARYQGGEARIRGIQGKGTTVTVTIPFDSKE